MSAALDLVVLNGPMEGEVVHLRPSEPLLLGRSSKGLQLIDPLVSLNHARIAWEGDRYWIEDRASATGTFVNDVRLAERAVVLVPGMRIRLGETDLEVRERPRSAMLRVVVFAASAFLLYLGVRAFMDSIEVHYDPVIHWFEPIHQGAGYASSSLRIPTAFIREIGVDHRGLQLEQVTDYDGNGIDELWLRWPDGRRLITFDPTDGSWRTLSDLQIDCRPKSRPVDDGQPAECNQPHDRVATPLPEICSDHSSAASFPDLDCSGTTYRWTDRGYEVAESEGLYAWMPPTRPVDRKNPTGPVVVIDGPPEPFLFTLVREGNLAGFLAERGVVEPIHYLVCEEAVPGVRAQVLTQDGELVPLSVGCIGDVLVEGPTRVADFADGVPVMFAMTGVGYEALIEDIALYLSGTTDRMFMTPGNRALYDAIASPPIRRRGALRVAFEGGERIFDPVAENVPVRQERKLSATEFHSAPPPRANVLTIDGSGRYDMAGCSEIDVEVYAWHCLFTKGCGDRSTFMVVRSVGCGNGAVAEIPYASNMYVLRDGVIDARIAVESIDQDGQIDVLRTRMAYWPAE
ncbi:MAG: FHA domain-containing protein [Alphaproteobacteria bacterium]|nr:FHA domain-containing protein [Alphaproteobacteria bacterium]